MKKFHITPRMVETTYEMLRASYPFRGWRLPEADAVEFHVRKLVRKHGTIDWRKDGSFVMEIDSGDINFCMDYLIRTVAHEMVHMRQCITKRRWVPTVGHGTDFKRYARQVCGHHGFNPQEF